MEDKTDEFVEACEQNNINECKRLWNLKVSNKVNINPTVDNNLALRNVVYFGHLRILKYLWQLVLY